MIASVLKKLLDEGKKPVVRLSGNLWEESFGQAGMIARVISATVNGSDLFDFQFDYNEHREHNLALDEPNWYVGNDFKKGTAIEAGHFKDPNNISEDVCFETDQYIPVMLVDEHTPLGLYLASGSNKAYVEWLEDKLEELVPDCMKDWKPMLEGKA